MYIPQHINDFAGRHAVVDVVSKDKTKRALIGVDSGYIDQIRRLFTVSPYLFHVELELTVVIMVTELF